MMIKRIGVTALAALFCCGVLTAQNEQIVYIDGVKYSVYTVAQGDTLYSLSKRYGVTIETLNQANPTLVDGLKAGQNIKIPLNSSSDTKSKKSAKRSKKLFRTHVVRQGETMYSIAKLYGVSVETLMADNGDIDPQHIAIGQSVFVRRNQIGTVSEQSNREQIVKQQDAMNSVAMGQYSYHLVHSGESAATIASRFGTTVEDLLVLNNFKHEANVREGLIIKVPKPQGATDVVAEGNKQEVEPVKELPEFAFKRLSATERADVALMLPLMVNNRRQANYVDFYQGFLLAADHLRLNGMQSHIHLYNTAHSNDKVAEIIDSGSLESCDLIVGPVYEDTLIPVARYGKEHSIPVVSPLANLTQSYDGNTFQMSPRLESKFDKVKGLFDGTKRVVLITSDNIDTEFEAEVKQLLGETPYTTHHYIYEHPSVIEKREKERDPNQEPIPSPSDLSPLMESEQNTLFIILSSTEVDVDRILAALASADISLKARSIKACKYEVFGNNKWNRYRNIDRSLYFSNNVIMLSTYHTDRTQSSVRDFGAEYIKAFGALPSLYAYRGYDAAMIFIRSLYGDIESGLENVRFAPLQTPYTFVKDSNSNVLVNSEWVRVNYNKNFTITTE